MTPVPDWQRTLHVTTELASVLLVPWVFAAARDARQPHKTRLQVLGTGMLLVDGYLLWRWWRLAR